MELQELVSRARILFNGAPKRERVFDLVNGRRSAREIADLCGRALTAILKDLQRMKELDVLVYKLDRDGQKVRQLDSIVYQKHPLLNHLPKSYFDAPTTLPHKTVRKVGLKRTAQQSRTIRVPTSQEIMGICKGGENQTYEFKSASTEPKTISKEVCAFANTEGGIIFYGVEDDGTIDNADMRRQDFDQRIQNSLRNTISPVISVSIVEKDVVGYQIFLVVVKPWNHKDIYQYEGRVYLRRGTNVFVAKPEEVRQLHDGHSVV